MSPDDIRALPTLSPDELRLLLDLGEKLVAELDLKQVLSLVADSACRVVHAETLVVPIIDADNLGYTYLAGSGPDADLVVGQKFPITRGTCGWVMRHQRPLLFGQDFPMQLEQNISWEYGMASSLLVPLICRGTIIGGLSAIGKQGGASFDGRDLMNLTLFANQASIAIDNARIVQELRTEKDKIQVTLHSIADAVLTTDGQGRLSYLNHNAQRLCGLDANAALHRPFSELIRFQDEATAQPLPDPVARCLSDRTVIHLEGYPTLYASNAANVAVECTASPLLDERGACIGAVIVLHDVSERRRLQTELVHQANVDALTGLANRWRFNRALTEALHSAKNEGRTHALVYMDLDQFKLVNDTCGHLAGDAMLKELSGLMAQHVRKSDQLARVGGDEFGLLLLDCDTVHAQRAADDMVATIRNYRFTHGGRQFQVGVSIGLVAITGECKDVTEVLTTADVACYTAKDLGGNRVHAHSSDDQEFERRTGEMNWVPRLRSALREDRFELFLQPIAPITAGAPIGRWSAHYEVLLRLRDDQDRLVPPGQFLPAAERYRLMQDIDQWVFDKVLARMRDTPPPTGTCLAINLSGASLSNDGFREYMLAALADHTRQGTGLCVEITETCAVQNLVAVARFVERLRELGCQSALDDFGSGLCSFGYLKQLPVDFLKIDGHLIKGVADNNLDLGMVESINRIGHLLGKQTVAEWVEDETTLDRLRAIGVDHVQGFGIGVPRPWGELLGT